MKYDLINFENSKVGDIELQDSIFSIPVRHDILARVIQYQLAKRRSGNHKTKTRSEVSKTGKKMYRQKGTGNARHRDYASPTFVGGGRAFGPRPRSYDQKLQKKVRILGLKMALSQKAQESNLRVFESKGQFKKTKNLFHTLKNCDLQNVLFVIPNDDFNGKEDFVRVVGNIPNVHVLPAKGLNVYDIFKYKYLAMIQDVIPIVGDRLL